MLNTKIGPYEILAPLGAGGMGEVFRARDPRLARDVAIKVLPADFSQDEDRLQRFEQEAQAAGVLNHPNVLSVFDIGSYNGSPYLVSELLDGETLRTKLEGGPIPQRKAIDYALQVARGLSAAHEKGIVHRDLKPENLFVTKDGRVKILDFGLAKLTQRDIEKEKLTQLPTALGTEPGMILGTMGYMSPEQVRGKPADHRSDIFSFGAILYEMLTGKKAFRGDSAADTMSAILHKDPLEATLHQSGITPALTRIISHCLEKDPEQRFHSASDVGFYLESLSNLSDVTSPAAALKPRRKISTYYWQILSAVLLIAVISLAISYVRLLQKPVRTVRAAIELPPKWDYDSYGGGMALSPDGKRIAFGANSQGKSMIWVRSLEKVAADPLPATEGATYPFWAPDGKYIGFFQNGKLKKIDFSGGPAEILCDAADGRGATWNQQGMILFSPSAFGPLRKVSEAGGNSEEVTKTSEKDITHRWPYFLPDGLHFLYTVFTANNRAAGGIFVGSLDSSVNRKLLPDLSNAIYQPPGYLIFLRNGNLMVQSFDIHQLALKGEPFRINQEKIFLADLRVLGSFTMSSDGTLAYLPDVSPPTTLTWVDPSGKKLGTLGDSGYYQSIALSPDGSKTAVSRVDPTTKDGDIWLYDNSRNIASRFTFQPRNYGSLVWSPDGSRLAFCIFNSSSGNGIYEKNINGSGGETLLVHSDFTDVPMDWSPDGQMLAYYEQGAAGNLQILLYRFSDRRSIPFSNNKFNERSANFSPDGKWIAYVSDSSGKNELYVRPLSGPGLWQISPNGSSGALWTHDGKRLLYGDLNQKIFSVDIQGGSNFEFGPPKEVFTMPKNVATMSITPDLSRILLATFDEMESTPITLVLNWNADLKK